MSFTTIFSQILDRLMFGAERARHRQEIAEKYCVSPKVLSNGLGFYRLNVDFHEAASAGKDVLPPVLVSSRGVASVDIGAVVRTQNFAKDICVVKRLAALHKQGYAITSFENPQSGVQEYKILPPKP